MLGIMGYLLIAGMLGVFSVSTYHQLTLVRDTPSDIRAYWYFYSLATVISLLIFVWAVQVGAISNDAAFSKSPNGMLLEKVEKAFFDLKTDLGIIGTPILIFVAPQVLGYVFSACFGCAGQPWLVGWALSGFVWTFIKFFLIISGIATAWIAADIYFGRFDKVFGYVLAIEICLFVSAMTLAIYRKGLTMVEAMLLWLPPQVRELVATWRKWASRHNNFAA